MTNLAATDPTRATPHGFAQAIHELLSLCALFEATPPADWPQLYARCIPWLTEARLHTKPPLPVQAITPLTREADWHLRSLAGLGTGKAKTYREHAAWAFEALEALERIGDPR